MILAPLRGNVRRPVERRAERSSSVKRLSHRQPALSMAGIPLILSMGKTVRRRYRVAMDWMGQGSLQWTCGLTLVMAWYVCHWCTSVGVVDALSSGSESVERIAWSHFLPRPPNETRFSASIRYRGYLLGNDIGLALAMNSRLNVRRR